jgi:probable addiction module antidote protein
MKVKLSKFDPVDYLKSETAIKYFLESAMESGDTKHIIHALGVAMKAQGLLKTAQKTGLNRSGLYLSFLGSQGNPRILTVAKVVDSLGYRLVLLPKNQRRAASGV